MYLEDSEPRGVANHPLLLFDDLALIPAPEDAAGHSDAPAAGLGLGLDLILDGELRVRFVSRRRGIGESVPIGEQVLDMERVGATFTGG